MKTDAVHPAQDAVQPAQDAVQPAQDAVHPIEVESYRILAERVDLRRWEPGAAALASRIVHATAEPGLLDDLVVADGAVEAGVEALRSGAPVLCDVEMVRAGITGAADTRCLLGSVPDAGTFPSRAAAAMARAAQQHPLGAVVAVGCAPTALAEVNRLVAEGSLRPALIVGVPVGFVGAAAAKDELLEVAEAAGVPVVALLGERGGAAVAAAGVNALVRMAGDPGHAGAAAAMVLVGHGTRSPEGEAELRRFADAVAAARPSVPVNAGYIEFVEPGLDAAVDAAVATGARSVTAVPLVLLGAGHLKDDGPATLAAARGRHPSVRFDYARDLGLHPLVLDAVAARAVEASGRLPGGRADAVVLVGRGSTDPDANADLAKAARLLADGRGVAAGADRDAGRVGRARGPEAAPALGTVEPAFVSLARPDVAAALDRCRLLGARRIAVVPYFLFAGLLVDRIAEQATAWGLAHPDVEVVTGAPIGVDQRLVALTWARYDEARTGPVRMNCDGCLYRAPLPGYEHRVGAAPFTPSTPHAGSRPSAGGA